MREPRTDFKYIKKKDLTRHQSNIFARLSTEFKETFYGVKGLINGWFYGNFIVIKLQRYIRDKWEYTSIVV